MCSRWGTTLTLYPSDPSLPRSIPEAHLMPKNDNIPDERATTQPYPPSGGSGMYSRCCFPSFVLLSSLSTWRSYCDPVSIVRYYAKLLKKLDKQFLFSFEIMYGHYSTLCYITAVSQLYQLLYDSQSSNSVSDSKAYFNILTLTFLTLTLS